MPATLTATAADTTGLPWAITVPSILAMRGKGIPPYGIGLAPKAGPLGAVLDAVLWKLVERAFAKTMLPGLNTLRAAAGLPVLDSPLGYYRLPDRLIVLTGAPLEYPRTDLPAHVRMVRRRGRGDRRRAAAACPDDLIGDLL